MSAIPAYELINAGDYNPYHLLIYMIANFITTNANSLLIYYYPKSEHRLTEGLLEILPPHFIRHLEKNPLIQYKQLLNVKPWFPDWTLPHDYDFLRQLFEPYCNTVRQGLRVYISRADAKTRRVINEDALLAILRPLNFIVITMSDLSARDQIQLFSQADILVAPHGAALTFMAFMDPRATVIELNRPMKNKRHFSHIAWHLDLDYYKVLCKGVGEEDMEVDVERLCTVLKANPKIANASSYP
jgi:hypothetical protein